MSTSKLPVRPSLESLRKQAKKLARDIVAGNLKHTNVEEPDFGRGRAGHLIHNFEGVRALYLVAIGFTPALIYKRPFVALSRSVVATTFEVVLDPIRCGRPQSSSRGGDRERLYRYRCEGAGRSGPCRPGAASCR